MQCHASGDSYTYAASVTYRKGSGKCPSRDFAEYGTPCTQFCGSRYAAGRVGRKGLAARGWVWRECANGYVTHLDRVDEHIALMLSLTGVPVAYMRDLAYIGT